MSETNPTEDLIRRLVLATARSEECLEKLISEARSEAENEIRELVRSAYKASMLRQAVERLESSEPVIESNSVLGCYVYAISLASQQQHGQLIDARGVDSRYTLEAVTVKDLNATVSLVSLAEFGQAALEQRTSDPRWLEEKIRAHDEVVVAAMSMGPVIPCRFCTVVRSAPDVENLLRNRHDEIKATLSHLRSKYEWGVKAYIDHAVLTKQETVTSGKDYLRVRQLEKKARESSVRMARTKADECYQELSNVAADSTRLSVQSNIQSNRANLILNSAHLVSELRVERFQKMIESLAERLGPSGITFEVSGPWPPYNFVNLDLTLKEAA